MLISSEVRPLKAFCKPWRLFVRQLADKQKSKLQTSILKQKAEAWIFTMWGKRKSIVITLSPYLVFPNR